MDKPTPMINSSMLPAYRGQIVRVVGRVSKITAQTLLMQTSDMGNVEVQLGRDTELQDAQFVEVIGKVADSGEVLREFTSVDLGSGVDMNLVEGVVTLSAKFPDIFTAQPGETDSYMG